MMVYPMKELSFCGAKTRKGGSCHRAAGPNGRCNLHGGKSLAGVAHPNFKTGRYSKYLPSQLTARYKLAEKDPQLLELIDEIALVNARLSSVLEGIKNGGDESAWAEVYKLID